MTKVSLENLPSAFHKRRKSGVCFACQITPSFHNPAISMSAPSAFPRLTLLCFSDEHLQ